MSCARRRKVAEPAHEGVEQEVGREAAIDPTRARACVIMRPADWSASNLSSASTDAHELQEFHVPPEGRDSRGRARLGTWAG